MRHLVKGRKLGRTTPHRKATLQALANALIEHKRIKTTLPKAKELRRFIEPLITKGKEDTTHNRRQVFSALNSKESAKIMFDEIAGRVADRPGGYTRILKLGFRAGDGTEEAFIELVDFSEYQPEKKDGKKSKTRRGGRRRAKSETTVDAAALPAAAKASREETDTSEETHVAENSNEVEESTDTDLVETNDLEGSDEVTENDEEAAGVAGDSDSSEEAESSAGEEESADEEGEGKK